MITKEWVNKNIESLNRIKIEHQKRIDNWRMVVEKTQLIVDDIDQYIRELKKEIELL